ncbi:TetR family transcriptional regulator [Pseudovibrio japonicus]|uniref:TetR family transcriptional regulator n=1 Tax=Pseudovibrio japonicus TaxID=366534 RepID=A0ABQ3E6X0_9HYPH|nr:TetR/AcrR family transcriptional regulator [Pseudovibrio japonicus]GHB28069.1 TetR family transcriptional regulator [Pseudovibrio japonicus]
MPRLTKQATRAKIREAVVAEATENGISATSVGGVVQRANISAGTIYVHFDNKEDMLQKIYLEIKTEFHELMMHAAKQTDDSEMIREMWFSLFQFVSDHPKDFLFVEYAGAAKILTEEQGKQVLKMQQEISGLLERAKASGSVADLPTNVISVLLIAPAMQLARSAVLKDTPVPQETVELTFDRVWLSISGNTALTP